MSDLLISGVIVGVLILLLFTPYQMANGIYKLDGNEPASKKALCFIPIINVMYAEKLYYGKFGKIVISTILFTVACILRPLAWYYMYDNVAIGTASQVLFWIALAFMAISNMIFVYQVIHDSGVIVGGKLWLFSIAFPFGQYYIGNFIVNAIRHMEEKEETFKRI